MLSTLTIQIIGFFFICTNTYSIAIDIGKVAICPDITLSHSVFITTNTFCKIFVGHRRIIQPINFILVNSTKTKHSFRHATLRCSLQQSESFVWRFLVCSILKILIPLFIHFLWSQTYKVFCLGILKECRVIYAPATQPLILTIGFGILDGKGG